MSDQSPSSGRHSLDLPPGLARPNLSLRPHLGVQTRLRARSVTSGGGTASAPTLPYLSPTLAGSPVLPSFDSFLQDAHNATASGSGAGGSFLSRARPRGASVGSSGLGLGVVESASEDDEDDSSADADDETVPSAEEGSSTESESPPQTPAEGYNAQPLPLFHLDLDRPDALPWGPYTREKRKEDVRLEGTRIGVRRGRSFTSLLMPALGSPSAVERQDPILEVASPPLSDLEFGEPDRPYAPSSKGNDLATFPPLATTAHAHATAPPGSGVKTLRDFAPQVALLAVLFVASFGMIAALVASLPNLFIPHSVSDLPQLTNALSAYRASSTFAELHLFVVLSFLFLWKQCFSIPGSVLTNILFGALYGTGAGTSWACLWTAGGSTGAYYIARIISPLVEHYLSTPLGMTRRALNLPSPSSTTPSPTPTASTSDLFSHLLLARFFPLLPYSVLNVISGVLGLPVSLFFITLVIGSFPFNFATVSVGELVALAASDPTSTLANKIWSPAVLQKLVLVTLISVLPVVFKKPLQRWATSPELRAIVGAVPTHARFLWGRMSGAMARRVFGFEGQIAQPQPGTSGGGHQAQRSSGGGSGRGWRHKWSPSISGDGIRIERTAEDVLESSERAAFMA
ncbi:hypothetical protein RQP46_001067 [Phenoliferia psychrophenolica]